MCQFDYLSSVFLICFHFIFLVSRPVLLIFFSFVLFGPIVRWQPERLLCTLLTFLNWWALITQSAHIPHIIHLMNKEIVCYWNVRIAWNKCIRIYSMLPKRPTWEKKATSSSSKIEKKNYLYVYLVFFVCEFSIKKSTTNEKVNEFHYLPNLFEIIPTTIYIFS